LVGGVEGGVKPAEANLCGRSSVKRAAVTPVIDNGILLKGIGDRDGRPYETFWLRRGTTKRRRSYQFGVEDQKDTLE